MHYIFFVLRFVVTCYWKENLTNRYAMKKARLVLQKISDFILIFIFFIFVIHSNVHNGKIPLDFLFGLSSRNWLVQNNNFQIHINYTISLNMLLLSLNWSNNNYYYEKKGACWRFSCVYIYNILLWLMCFCRNLKKMPC